MVVRIVVVTFGQTDRVPKTADVDEAHEQGEEQGSDEKPNDDKRNADRSIAEPTFVLDDDLFASFGIDDWLTGFVDFGFFVVRSPQAVKDHAAHRSNDVFADVLVDLVKLRSDRVHERSRCRLRGVFSNCRRVAWIRCLLRMDIAGQEDNAEDESKGRYQGHMGTVLDEAILQCHIR